MQSNPVRGAWINRFWNLAAAAVLCGLAACGGGGGGGGGDPVPTPVAPSITTQPASITVQAGQSATFSVAATGDGPLAYQWLRNSNVIAGAVQASYTLVSPTMADTNTRFAVRVSNAAGTVTSAEAVLTVTPPPVVVPPISIVKSGLGMVKGIGVDAAGNTLFVNQETANNEFTLFLRKMAADGTLLDSGIAGRGILTTPFSSFLPHTENYFAWGGSAFDSAGNYIQAINYFSGGFNYPYVLEGGVISKVTPDGAVTKLVEWPVGRAGAMALSGIGFGPDGTLYFLDQRSGNLVAWTPQTGTRVLAKVRPPTGFTPLPAIPVPIAVTADNKIYVMDRALVKRIDGAAVTIVAGQVSEPVPSGDTGFGMTGTADGAGSAARFIGPTSMVADAAGNLLVADFTTIRKVTPAGVVTTVAGIPAPSQFPGPTFAPLQEGPLTNPLGIQVGPIAIGADGVVHAFVYESYLGPRTLVKIRLK